MTHQTQSNAFENLLELLVEHESDRMAEAMAILLNEAIKLERTKVLGAAPYERSEHRVGYANGYKQKTVASRFGKMTLDVPRTRDSEFYPGVLERGERSERALKLALAEMYVQGGSTRKFAALPEGLTIFDLPPKIRRRLRTTNLLERINKLKRRTRVATLLPHHSLKRPEFNVRNLTDTSSPSRSAARTGCSSAATSGSSRSSRSEV